VLLGAGALGVFGTLALLPKSLADATPVASSRQIASASAHVEARGKGEGSGSTTTLPSPTTTTVPAPSHAAPSIPAPTPTSTTVPRSPSAPAVPAASTVTRGILPPQNPATNIPPEPNFLNDCSGQQYDDSAGCVSATLAAIANGRAAEGLPAMTLPGNWGSLSPQEQLFVATNLERTVRGLPELPTMVSPLDQASTAGAASNVDPSPPSGFGFVRWGSNWAGAVGNPLEAIYFWMYDDGPGSSNIDCTAGNSSGCWGHRDNVLLPISGPYLQMGVGYVASAYQGTPSWTELLVQATGPSPVDFSS